MAFGSIYTSTNWGSVCDSNIGWGNVYRFIANCNPVAVVNLIAENGDNLIDENNTNLISN